MFALKAVPAIPTVCETAPLFICVLVFLTKPIGFLNVILALCLPSSDTLNESMALDLMLSIGPLLLAFLQSTIMNKYNQKIWRQGN